MKFTHLEIPDLILIEPKIYCDDRGFFFESYRQSIFQENGITEDFIQDNHVSSSRGALRGLHYQLAPMTQSKLIRVIQGKIFDVALDIRKESPTFGKYVGVTLDAEKRQTFYIPKGFAHGYCALKNDSEVIYKVSKNYSPEHERGILWSDPAVGIQWPDVGGDYLLSEKDQKYPTLKNAVVFS